MIRNKEHIEREIGHNKRELEYWQGKLVAYLEAEYKLRRNKCLEVESDRKDLERARQALELLREAYKDD